MSLGCLPSSLGSIRISVWPLWQPSWMSEWNKFSSSELPCLPNAVHQNRAILNLYIAPKPPIKFQLDPTYGMGEDVFWRFSRWPIWWPSWILEKNDFSNSNSPCGPNASHQVWAQSDLGFRSPILNLYVAPSDLWFWRRCCLKNFNMAAVAAKLNIRMEQF